MSSQTIVLIVVIDPLVVADTGGHAARGGDPHLALHPLLVEGPGHLGVQVRPAGGLLSLLDVGHDVPLH